jgi:tRNA 5-methylaminomethyl-2-thiouridine biosynthesis bifunctional protein
MSYILTNQPSSTSGKGYQIRPKITKPEQVIIIGGGIASACAAYALTKQGVKVTLLCKENTVAQGASSNAIGALYPLLHQQKDDISEFYQHAFWRAKALYQEVLDLGFNYSHDWCGLLDLSYKPSLEKHQQRFEQLDVWPHNLIHSVNSKQASKIAQIPLTFGGLFMPHAGWVAPQELVSQLFNAANKTNYLSVENNIEVNKLTPLPDGRWLLDTNKRQFKEEVVIVCGGAETLNINIVNKLPLTSVRGQVTSMHSNEHIEKLATVLCHKGYLTPKNNNIHCIGATFDKNDFDTKTRSEDDEYNINILSECLNTTFKATKWDKKDIVSSKARLRCMTPDHLPLVGAMPDLTAHRETYAHLAKDKNWRYDQPAPVINNLYVMTGFGARGLCSAPLLADIISADICGLPYPVDNKMLFNLSANRFIIRDIIRRKI